MTCLSAHPLLRQTFSSSPSKLPRPTNAQGPRSCFVKPRNIPITSDLSSPKITQQGRTQRPEHEPASPSQHTKKSKPHQTETDKINSKHRTHTPTTPSAKETALHQTFSPPRSLQIIFPHTIEPTTHPSQVQSVPTKPQQSTNQLTNQSTNQSPLCMFLSCIAYETGDTHIGRRLDVRDCILVIAEATL